MPSTEQKDVNLALAPCPFCGARGERLVIVRSELRTVRVDCDGCEVGTMWYDTDAEAIAAWNRRHSPSGDGWISVEERLPDSLHEVLAFYRNALGKRRIVRALYAAPHSLPLDEDCEGVCACGACPDDGETWAAPGWYESNEHEETHWAVDESVTHWRPLPDPPTIRTSEETLTHE